MRDIEEPNLRNLLDASLQARIDTLPRWIGNEEKHSSSSCLRIKLLQDYEEVFHTKFVRSTQASISVCMKIIARLEEDCKYTTKPSWPSSLRSTKRSMTH
jgi:hypothetical protein